MDAVNAGEGQLMHEGRRNGGRVFSDDAAGDA